MALTSPITVTINAVDKACVKINQDAYGSHYRYSSETERVDLKIRHQPEKPNSFGVTMDRHNVEITHTVFSDEAGVPDVVVQAYCVLRNASTNLSTDLPYLGVALADLMKVSGNLAALVNWQN